MLINGILTPFEAMNFGEYPLRVWFPYDGSPLPQVTNTSKDTSLRWFKDGVEVTQVVYDPSSGFSTLTIPQVHGEILAFFGKEFTLHTLLFLVARIRLSSHFSYV